MIDLTKEKEYYADFSKIVEMIETRRKNAYRKVNEELISLYWDVGCYVSKQIQCNKWGSKVVEKLSLFIRDKYPTLQDFSRPGIYSKLVTGYAHVLSVRKNFSEFKDNSLSLGYNSNSERGEEE